jgi:protease-4
MKTALKILSPIILVAILVPILFYAGLTIWGDWHDAWSGYNASTYIGDGYCNIAVLPIEGDIHGYGGVFDDYGNRVVSTNMRDAISFLEQAEYEPGIYGVLALVNSTGGSGAAAEQIATTLKQSMLPNAAYIVDSGASAAYLVASAADIIIASPFSDVGSLGVTMSYLDYSAQNMAQGIEYVSLSSALFKNYGDPDRPLTSEERALLERDLDVWHNELVAQVAENRKMSIDKIAALADGSSMPGRLAQAAGLVDVVGDREVVRDWFATQLGISREEVVFCGY